MTTILERLLASGLTDYGSLLHALGIDPDLPAEWATVDRCLDWLRAVEPPTRVLLYTPMSDAVTPQVVTQRDRKDGDRTRYDESRFNAPTLHAALIAACRAVQEAQPKCAACGQAMHYIECPTGGWWAHEVHPQDDHDAVQEAQP